MTRLDDIEKECEFHLAYNTRYGLPIQKRYQKMQRMARVIRELALKARAGQVFEQIYGKHDPLCDKLDRNHDYPDPLPRCSCGYDDARAILYDTSDDVKELLEETGG